MERLEAADAEAHGLVEKGDASKCLEGLVFALHATKAHPLDKKALLDKISASGGKLMGSMAKPVSLYSFYSHAMCVMYVCTIRRLSTLINTHVLTTKYIQVTHLLASAASAAAGGASMAAAHTRSLPVVGVGYVDACIAQGRYNCGHISYSYTHDTHTHKSRFCKAQQHTAKHCKLSCK